MKRCSFLACFALIFILAMPMRAEAASMEWPSDYPEYTSYTESEGYDRVMWYRGYGRFGSQYAPSYKDVYHMVCFKLNQDSGVLKVVFDGSKFNLNFTPESEGDSFSYVEPYMWVPSGANLLEYAWNEEELVTSTESVTLKANGTMDTPVNEVLYSTVSVYNSDGSFFFQRPRTLGKLEKELTTVLQTMEVDPLTEVLKILPIGLACLVGWIGLRKGLSLLQTLLSQA